MIKHDYRVYRNALRSRIDLLLLYKLKPVNVHKLHTRNKNMLFNNSGVRIEHKHVLPKPKIFALKIIYIAVYLIKVRTLSLKFIVTADVYSK